MTELMDFAAIRRQVIISAFADDVLMRRLVLKGGNPLSLVHGIGKRSSIDIDLSLGEDLAERELGDRLRRSLEDRFDSLGLEVFDFRLQRRPANREGRPATWGGYSVGFKLLEKRRKGRLSQLADRRRQAVVVAPGQKRVFSVEISRHEYTAEKQEAEFEGYTIYVYPPAMIAVEKLRAICQQMPEYRPVRTKRARARDFYDIRQIIVERGLDLGSTYCRALVASVFAAQEVPLELLERIPEQREFHRVDWPAVVASVSEDLTPASFDIYFDFVVEETKKLKPLGDV